MNNKLDKLTNMIPKRSQNLSKIDHGRALEASWEPPLKQGASKTSSLTSLSAFRGSPSTPEMLCGLRLQGPLLMHPAVALGSALTARGPAGGPFRARPGAHWAGPRVGPKGPSPAAAHLLPSVYREEEDGKGNWLFLDAAAQMALRKPLEAHFDNFWGQLAKWLPGDVWRLIFHHF